MNGIELKLEPSDNVKVDNLVQEGEKVTDEKIEESLNYDLLSDEEKNRAMGRRGYQRFKEDFDMQVVNRRLEELFTELIEGIL